MRMAAGAQLQNALCHNEKAPQTKGLQDQEKWSGRRESNPHDQLGRLELYH